MNLENQNSFNAYLKSVNKHNLIDENKERELLVRIKNGDKKAENELTMANARFVIFVAKKYQYTPGVDFQDLISEGNIGLINAARKFDLEKDVKFISYAVWWIRQSITKYINEHARTIRLPVNILNNMRSDEGDVSDNIAKTTKSLDSSFYDNDDDDYTLSDFLATDEDYTVDLDLTALNEIIKDALSHLSPREADILIKYYGLNDGVTWSLDSISEEYDLTKERVRQIKTKAITKLRHNSELFHQFFD